MSQQATAVSLRALSDQPVVPRTPGAPPARRRKAPLILGALVAAAAGIGTYLYVSSAGKESSDDAQVEGHVSNVAARVPGEVKRVLVRDNQHVKVGDVLVELDDADYVAKLD